MRTIAIINQKGGCGKTTVSINLAAVMAAMGQRTLLVDMDPQSHCALGLAVPEAQVNRSVTDLLRAGLDGTIVFADAVWQIARHLDLAPSNMALATLEQELSKAPDRDRRLVQVLSTVQDHYDFCIIDCPPSIGLLTFNALRASDEVIVPVETGYFALQGSIRQEQTIEMLVRRTGHQVRHKVLATMYDVRTKLAREILSELRKHFDDKLLPVVINFNSKLKEAASLGQPITEYDPASRGMQDFEKLAAWLISHPPTVQTPEMTAPSSAAANPALSRAAELVERARALSARTAAITGRLPQVSPAADPTRRHPVGMHNDDAAADHGDGRHDMTPEPQIDVDRLSRVFGARATRQGVLFVQPLPTAGRLSVAGDFNNWTPIPMKKDEHLGVWQACVQVPPGRYRYRLVADGEWQPDPYNEFNESNGLGEVNSIIEVS